MGWYERKKKCAQCKGRGCKACAQSGQVGSGRYYVRWQANGVVYRKALGEAINTETKAKKAWQDFNRKRLDQKLSIIDPSRITLGAFISEYLTHRARLPLSPATKRQDKKALDSLAAFLGQGFLLRSITQRKLQEWSGHLVGRGRSPFTARSYLSHILAALETAVDWGRLRNMPRIKRRAIIKTPELLPRALTPAEVQTFLEAETNPERRALWEFLIWTGLRRAEFYGLAWQDVHIDQDSPWIKVTGKGGKERIVPLLPAAVEALKTFPRADVGPVFTFSPLQKAGLPRPSAEDMAELMAIKSNVKIGRMFGVSDVTIAKWAQKPIKRKQPIPGTISQWLKKTLRSAGIEEAHLHDLRHTAATWMAARGVSEHVIQSIMGHASITTTQRYTKGMARIADLYKQLSVGLDENN